MAGRGWGGTHQSCGCLPSYWVALDTGLSLLRLLLSPWGEGVTIILPFQSHEDTRQMLSRNTSLCSLGPMSESRLMSGPRTV